MREECLEVGGMSDVDVDVDVDVDFGVACV